MRGRVARTVLVTAKFGITPAYAGKSPDGTKMVTQSRDHPRICGEEICEGLGCRGALGSPPRMRGRGGLRVRQWLPAGITPAYAGKSPLPLCRHGSPWDHPRVCGEERQCYLVGVATPGSPPRMRGRERGSARKGAPSRITPAYAGKRTGRYTPFQAWEDHPRVCGEERLPPPPLGKVLGSPPRMRGRGAGEPLRLLDGGITPAYAGKSWRGQLCPWAFQDHPRVCGEEVRCAAGCGPLRGSPPRMRGRVDAATLTLKARGITPAYAGKSYAQRNFAHNSWDHPRVCGEESLACCFLVLALGSPPRMRGRVRTECADLIAA